MSRAGIIELRRRVALARLAQPAGVPQPALRMLLGEAGTRVDYWRARRRHGPVVPVAATTPRAVMLVPGFAAHAVRMHRMRRGLKVAGHRVSDWGLGWNLGATPDKLARFADRVAEQAVREGEPLVLVGWSLGGMYAREAARVHPEAVRLVVTMGTPFSGDFHANNVWRAYHLIAGHDVSDPPLPGDLAAKPPVPTVALWSPRDGVVHRRAASGRPGERDSAVALRCTHLGFAGHPTAIAEVLRQIDRLDD